MPMCTTLNYVTGTGTISGTRATAICPNGGVPVAIYTDASTNPYGWVPCAGVRLHFDVNNKPDGFTWIADPGLSNYYLIYS